MPPGLNLGANVGLPAAWARNAVNVFSNRRCNDFFHASFVKNVRALVRPQGMYHGFILFKFLQANGACIRAYTRYNHLLPFR